MKFLLKKHWCQTLVNTQVFPHHQSQRKDLVIVMASFLLNCTHCVKSVFVVIVIRVALILLLSVTCRSLVVTVSSQLWLSINTAAAEAFMFRALFPRFALLCIHWINFTLIESSPDLSAFKLYWCVRWCESAGALFNFSVLHLSPICMCVRMWVCVCANFKREW